MCVVIKYAYGYLMPDIMIVFHFNFSPQHGTSSESADTKVIISSKAQSVIFLSSHSWRVLNSVLLPEFGTYCWKKRN